MDAPTADPPIGLDEAGDGDPPLASPFLVLDSFAGPLAQLLARARAQKIDLARISLPALLDQLAAALHVAGRVTPLGQQGDWLVMAAWLVLLRSRLLLPAGSPAQQDAAREAGQLRARLRDLQAAQALAAWLERRPQLGHDFFGPGQPERAGTEPEPAPQVDVIEFLWAAMALFDDGSSDVDTASVYRPAWQDLHGVLDARQRLLRLLAALPDGASLGQLLPAARMEGGNPARVRLRRRSAWASTFLAGLELERQGLVVLAQDAAFAPIQVRPADGASVPG
ncbi:MAG TPA: segregation/condensation protein A [Acetobacteraceae bacterium]|nr:segregation/condensation protein A [Acetobacteraceae bacterium]